MSVVHVSVVHVSVDYWPHQSSILLHPTPSHAHRSDIQTTPFLHLRYEKTDCALMCAPDLSVGGGETSSRHGDFEKAFTLR